MLWSVQCLYWIELLIAIWYSVWKKTLEILCNFVSLCVIFNVWISTSFSFTFTAVCRRQCQNGGRCFKKDQCSCPYGYWGDVCQYGMSCDDLFWWRQQYVAAVAFINYSIQWNLRKFCQSWHFVFVQLVFVILAPKWRDHFMVKCRKPREKIGHGFHI